MPSITIGLSDGQFVARNVKGCAFPPVGRFDLDEPISSVRLETRYVIARTVAIFDRSPTNPFRQISSTRTVQHRPFVFKHTLFGQPAYRHITCDADRHWQAGPRLNGRKDIIFDATGGMWFTDHGKTYGRQMDRGAAFHAAAGELEKVA
jgi:hypothetical protein